MPKEKLHEFVNDFPLTQLKDYIKHEHDKVEKIVKRVLKLLKLFPLFKTKIEKPFIKLFTNKLLHELPFYDKSTITRNAVAFKVYARSY